MKFRGHENTCSQIHASFSDDAKYVICGSEDQKAYIWSTGSVDSENKDKRPLEVFEAHSEMVTTAIIAPTHTRQLLSGSGDPIYDLCNPPPVTLLSREESNASSLPQVGSEKRHSDPVSEPHIKESPAYLARSQHNDGLIIVTSDYSGLLKVYRCDCAFEKRHNWDSGSAFSKKILGRTNSIMTRNSAGSASRRNSVSQTSLTNPHDHILTWRSNVNSDGSIRSVPMTSRSDRSVSPGKFTRTSYQSQSTSNSQNNLASAARQQPYAGSTPFIHGASSVSTTSPPPSIHKSTTSHVTQLPTPGFSFVTERDDENPLKLDAAGKSNSFWSMSSWKGIGSARERDPTKLDAENARPGIERGETIVSRLSIDDPSNPEESDESESETLSCKKCSGKDFRAKRVQGKGLVMVCTKCGTNVG